MKLFLCAHFIPVCYATDCPIAFMRYVCVTYRDIPQSWCHVPSQAWSCLSLQSVRTNNIYYYYNITLTLSLVASALLSTVQYYSAQNRLIDFQPIVTYAPHNKGATTLHSTVPYTELWGNKRVEEQMYKKVFGKQRWNNVFSYVSQNPCRGTAKKLQRKYNSVAIAQNGKEVFHSDIAYKIW